MRCAHGAMGSDKGVPRRFCEPVYWHGLTLVNHGTQAEVLRGVEARPTTLHAAASHALDALRFRL